MEGKDPAGHLLREAHGYVKVNTTLKHFAANNSEFNRRTGSSDMDDRTLREYYTAQFRRTIGLSDPASIMSAYNRINGTPAPANGYLNDVLARETFGFGGFFTSDCDAIFEIQAGHHWQPPGFAHPLDQVERHAFAASAGEDLDCNQGFHDAFSYANTVAEAIARNITTGSDTFNENDVDTSVVRLFAARIRQGEFDDEHDVPWITQARARVPAGSWTNSDANNAITETPERLAMARQVGAEAIVLLKNAETTRKDGRVGKLLPLRVPAVGPFRVAVIGAYANPASMYLGGYASIQGAAGIAKEVNGYQGIVAAVHARNPGAVVDFFPGVTPDTLAAVDPASVAAAAGYDVAIVYVGTDVRHSREDVDRTTLALPGAQAELISQVAARNPSTIVYMETVGQIDVGSFEPAVAALLWSSYNGQRKGEALADVVLGAHDPGGRLPFSWYASVADLPAVGDYSIRPTAGSLGRTYMYFQGAVAYPFGHGLSYTSFRVAQLRVDGRRFDASGTIHASAEVTNTGALDGETVVELYVTTPGSPAALERPAKRLRGFRKLALGPRETRRVEFEVKIDDLAFFDQALGRFVVDPGKYRRAARGSGSGDGQARGRGRPRAGHPAARVLPARRDRRAAAHGGDERRQPVRLRGARRQPAAACGDAGPLREQPAVRGGGRSPRRDPDRGGRRRDRHGDRAVPGRHAVGRLRGLRAIVIDLAVAACVEPEAERRGERERREEEHVKRRGAEAGGGGDPLRDRFVLDRRVGQ